MNSTRRGLSMLKAVRFDFSHQVAKGQFDAFGLRLICCQFLNLVCLVEQLSPWLIAYALVSLIWQSAIACNLLRNPTSVLKIVFALSGVTILALSSLSMGILLSMVHLLCLAYILKPLELKTRRDVQQIKLLNLFVLGAALIFHQSLQFAIVVIILLIINVALFSEGFVSTSKFRAYKLTTLLLCQSLPMAILLFITFPKLGPFWQMPHASSAQVGLSDTVKIGDIANLALSNELAFRVEFDSFQPNPSTMYWRTIVLEKFDGIAWQRRDKVPLRHIQPKNSRGAFNYDVFVEPNNQTWLFGLDVAWINSGKTGRNLADYTMRSNSKISNTVTYQVTSYPNVELDKYLSQIQQEFNLNIPEASNPQLTAYGRQLRSQYREDKAVVQAVLTTFNQQDYRYTLKPPLLANNSLDQFFFGTKAGFCEHYASSFAYLMRAAGIPARVVVGYLGGELNERGGYYSIFQRDAHAWSEVWLANEGWVRVDPTAAVDISRIEQGFYDSLLQEQRELSGNLKWLDELINAQWAMNMASFIDAIDYQWTKWVIGYSAASQLQLLNNWLGGYSLLKIAGVIFGVMLGSVLLLFLINMRISGAKAVSVQVHYMHKLQRYLAVQGCRIDPSDTGKVLIQKASAKNIKLHRPVENFIKLFQQLEYAESSDGIRARQIKLLKLQWKAIKRVR